MIFQGPWHLENIYRSAVLSDTNTYLPYRGSAKYSPYCAASTVRRACAVVSAVG